MHTRKYEPRDLDSLNEIAVRSGFPYPDPASPLIESCYVVVDDNDKVLMAVAAERIVQAYLWVGEIDHPAAKLHAIKLLLKCAMRHELSAICYHFIEAYVPPKWGYRFGRRLEKLGFTKNWDSWSLKL